MTKIIFKTADGTMHPIEIATGLSIMEGAVKNNLAGIDADCGGACACATCHIYIDEAWNDKINPIKPAEEDMLDFAFDVRKTSRLSCQICVTDDMDGMIVEIPAQQF